MTMAFAGLLAAQSPRPRARDLGIKVGILPTGELNAITDVAGVEVGQVTLDDHHDIHTGVTAILPHPGNMYPQKVPGAVFVGNAFGKLMGSTQIEELGEIETPILLTSTLNVPRVADALISYMLALPGNQRVQSINPVVGETNDGGLNDIRGRHVGEKEVFAAIENARGGPVEEGAVGAGAGTIAFGFKGGIGTASRHLPANLGGYTVIDWRGPQRGCAARPACARTGMGTPEPHAGAALAVTAPALLAGGGPPFGSLQPFAPTLPKVQTARPPRGVLVQTNFGGILQIDGAPVGVELGQYYLKNQLQSPPTPPPYRDNADGSCMIVIATDAPVEARNLKRMAARAMMGLARTGSAASNGSGDYAIAFSTASGTLTGGAKLVGNDAMSPLFLAVIEATEEAIYNSLFRATTTTGRGRTVEALPLDATLAILKRHGVIAEH